MKRYIITKEQQRIKPRVKHRPTKAERVRTKYTRKDKHKDDDNRGEDSS